MPRCLTVSGGTLFHFAATRADVARRSRKVLKGIKDGWLQLRIDHVLPLAEAEKIGRLSRARASQQSVPHAAGQARGQKPDRYCWGVRAAAGSGVGV